MDGYFYFLFGKKYSFSKLANAKFDPPYFKPDPKTFFSKNMKIQNVFAHFQAPFISSINILLAFIYSTGIYIEIDSALGPHVFFLWRKLYNFKPWFYLF